MITNFSISNKDNDFDPSRFLCRNTNNCAAVVKLSDALNVVWSKKYCESNGHQQVFDILVDNDGNYLLGGHTDAGVRNWDYLALKVDRFGNKVWRKTFGQPRGFREK